MRLAGCGIKNMKSIFKTEMFIYQSKAKLAEKISFRKLTHHLDPEIWKMPVNGKLGTRIPHSILIHDSFAVEKEILFLKMTM